MDITNIQSQSVFNNYIWIANPFLNCGGLQIRHINNENISTDGIHWIPKQGTCTEIPIR